MSILYKKLISNNIIQHNNNNNESINDFYAKLLITTVGRKGFQVQKLLLKLTRIIQVNISFLLMHMILIMCRK